MGMELFENRPQDPDTRIIKTQHEIFDGLDVLLEAWVWEGVIGQSAILVEEQVAPLDDAAIVQRLASKLPLGGKYNVSRSSGFVFVNYGFEAPG